MLSLHTNSKLFTLCFKTVDTFLRREHRMGWEENKNLVAKKIRKERKQGKKVVVE